MLHKFIHHSQRFIDVGIYLPHCLTRLCISQISQVKNTLYKELGELEKRDE